MGKVMVQGQPGQKEFTRWHLNGKKLGIVVYLGESHLKKNHFIFMFQ
jgi:hypothetical protein